MMPPQMIKPKPLNQGDFRVFNQVPVWKIGLAMNDIYPCLRVKSHGTTNHDDHEP